MQHPDPSFCARFYISYLCAVVYLDADTLVLRNIDALFGCPGICGVLRHSERLNTGVLALTPSTALFEDMQARITLLESYTGCEHCCVQLDKQY